jgi:hypothetical protein
VNLDRGGVLPPRWSRTCGHDLSRYLLPPRGGRPPSRLLVDTIDARFGTAASVEPTGSDTAVLLTADQSSLRALLTLLWDVGHDLVTVSACADEQEPDENPSPAGPLGRTRPSHR